MVHDPSAAGPSIAGYVEARAGDSRPGLVFEDRTWSWAEIVDEARRRAGLLTQMHRAGPFHVGVLLENTAEYVFLLFGAALAGATVVGLNSTRRGEELGADIAHCDCEWVLADDQHLSLLPPSAPVVNVDSADYRSSVAAATWPGGSDGPADGSDGPADGSVGPESLYLLIFTSGSTGMPKAVCMSQGRAARTAGEAARGFGPDDVLYCTMPLFHGNALWANLLPALISGASVVLRRRFSASAFLPDIQRHRCTYFNYVGRVLSYIVAVAETPEDKDNSLKWCLGSEASPQNIAEFTRRFGCPVIEGYGSSENAVVIVPVAGTPPGAMGKPKRGMDVAIIDTSTGLEQAVARFDASGRLANPAEAIGEIVGRNTAGMFEGYYRNPDAEALRLREGWYWTGDLGYRDEDGFFYFAGRTADWLRVDGENFSAGSVERILNRFEGPSGVAIYGVPDALSGDAVMAAVEVATPSEFDVDRFATFLSSQPDLGTKWVPRFVRAVRAVPTTGAGKVDKSVLRREAWSVDDPVWWRPDRGDNYRRFTASDAEELRAAFAASGRSDAYPGARSAS